MFDNRSVLERVDYSLGEVYFLFLVSYVEEGLLLTILRTLESSKGDHVAVSVFVPHGAVLETKDWKRVISEVRQCVYDDTISETSLSRLRTLFSEDYPFDPSRPAMLPSGGRGTAVAYYNSPAAPSFDEYCAANFYQPAYTEYESVLLVDGQSGMIARFDNVTEPKLKRVVPLSAPARTSQGFEPYIFRLRFNKTYLVADGSTVDIVWRRSGFETINQRVDVRGVDTVIDQPDTSLARKLISPTSFFVTSQGNREAVGAYQVKVNGRQVDGPEPFTYNELINAKVEISAPGYLAFTGNFDLASSSRALIQMRQLHRTYRFDLPLLSPEPVEAVRIYLKSKKALTVCPIEGYKVIGDDIVEGSGVANTLVYIGGGEKKNYVHMAIAAIAGLLLGLLVGFIAFRTSEGETSPGEVVEIVGTAGDATEENTANAEIKSVAEEKASQTVEEPMFVPDYARVAEYLDSHKAWRKSDLQALNAARLFDDMNTYNFESLINDWGPKLTASKNFASVVRAATQGASKRDPRTGRHSPNYNPDGDEAITWLPYTYWIDP
ncbi:MAG: hypothetical protein K2F79_04710 [Muribaculaceae bacterium]|nr:hypothetical protein [Muribaculaceae bacterium]